MWSWRSGDVWLVAPSRRLRLTSPTRDASSRTVWIDDMVQFMANLVNTEILLAPLTGKIDHLDHAIKASTVLNAEIRLSEAACLLLA